MSFDRSARLLHQLAARDMIDSFDAWPAIHARVRARRIVPAWRVAAAASACVLAAAAVLVGLNAPATVSAEALLGRAEAMTDGVAGSVPTYHILATSTLRPAGPGSGAPVVTSVETWSGGSGRMRQTSRTPDWTSTIVSNGQQTWWQITRGGETYVSLANGIRFSDAARLNPLAPPGGSIASIIDGMRQRGCGTTTLEPDQSVAGRPAYVVRVQHVLREAGCADPAQAMAEPSPSAGPDARASADDEQRRAAKLAAARTTPSPAPAQPGAVIQKPVDPAQQAKLDQLMATPVVDTYWIDKQTFVLLEAEQNLGPKGTSLYEVSSASFGLSLPDSTFEFAPAPGDHLLADPAEVKRTLANR